jgi:outer membrane protein TolC
MTMQRYLRVGLVALIGWSPGLAAGTLTLNAAIERLPKTLEWQSADLTYLAAQRNLDTARAAAGLKVSVGADGSYSVTLIGANGNAAGSTNSSVSVNASASLTVLPWSSNYDAVRTQTRALYRAGLTRDDARVALALKVVQQYGDARVAVLDASNATAAEALAAQQLAVAERQFQNGQVSKDSLETTRKALENAKLTTLQTRQNLELTRLQLGQTLGISITDETLEAATARALPVGTLETLIGAAVLKRTDVLRAISVVSDAEDSLANANRDRWLPSATLSTSVGQGSTGGGTNITGSLNVTQGTATVTANTPVTGANTAPTSLTIAASFSIPLIAPSSDAKTASAQASLDSAKKTLESTRQSALLDVRQKFNDAALQTQKLSYTKTVLQNAQNSLETTQKRFSLGSVTTLEVTSAKNAVSQAARDLEAQTITQSVSVYRLENAVGTPIIKGDNQ